MSLRFRLNLLITILSLLFMSAVGFVTIKGMRTSTQEGVEAATRVTVQLLDTVILSSENNPQWGYTHNVLQRFLQHLGYVRSSKIYLYDLQGSLLFESPPSTYRAEVSPPLWFAKLMEPKQEVVTRNFGYGKLIIESNPGGAIREAWVRVTNLFWLGLAFFVLLNAVVYWMVGQSLRPLNAMLRAINQFERGDLAARLPLFKLPEFKRMAQNFNSMGESLQISTEENRRLALIVRQTADAVMIHDLDGNISFWNPAAQRIFGYTNEEIIGRSASLLTAPGTEADLEQNLAAIRERRSIEPYDTQRIAKNGRIVDVSLSAAPLVDPNTEGVIGEICSMRDITERKLAEEAEERLEENRELTRLIQRHIEDERRSLSRELHDELGQYVTAIKTFAVGIANKTRVQMPEVESSAQTIVAAANHIYDGMHNIIRQLRPGSLDNLGLPETLRDTVSNWQTQHPDVHFSLKLTGKLDELGETVNINLYRIVQESVTNALRHAQATAIDIELCSTDRDEVQLTIKDNGMGIGMCNVDQGKHFGLLGMRERTQALQGRFSIDSVLERGTSISVTIPKGRDA
jgi:two-component system sensor histidine kinase UhpB